MTRVTFAAAIGAFGGVLTTCAPQAQALVYCVTNAVDAHQSAPTGAWADSGWQQTAPVGIFLATVIHPGAALTAKHLNFQAGQTFDYEGQTRSVSSVVNDADSDLSVLFFTPPATNFALVNIETNDASAFVVLQGRGMERGEVVVSEDGRTNGWQWAWDKWWSIRRWGVNRYIGEVDDDGKLAMAAFDNNGDPDECMLSPGDSGGPGFVRTGSGWKVATVNYSVGPDRFTVSTNPVSAFNASLFDCTGLYYDADDNGTWSTVPPEEAPSPCLMFNTRTSKRLAWLTNTVGGLVFPAEIGLAWRCETNRPTARQAASGVWFELVATNAGPYAARNLAVDFAWPTGLWVRAAAATLGTYASNRWAVPFLEDGTSAVLRIDAAVWRGTEGWGTNRAWVAASDKPDGVDSNNAADCAVWLPSTATVILVE